MAEKLKVATCSLAGCFGCHMSLLDIDERLLDLLEIAEFDRSPIKHDGSADLVYRMCVMGRIERHSRPQLLLTASTLSSPDQHPQPLTLC